MSEGNPNVRDTLPRWPDIKVKLEVTSGSVTAIEVTEDMLLEYEDNPPGNPPGTEDIIIRPFAYFKTEGKETQKSSGFLRVLYTPTAWDASIKAGKGEGGEVKKDDKPRIFYREYRNGWVGDWVEIEETKPFPEGIYRGLEVNLPNLPDPAIGGC